MLTQDKYYVFFGPYSMYIQRKGYINKSKAGEKGLEPHMKCKYTE